MKRLRIDYKDKTYSEVYYSKAYGKVIWTLRDRETNKIIKTNRPVKA